MTRSNLSCLNLKMKMIRWNWMTKTIGTKSSKKNFPKMTMSSRTMIASYCLRMTIKMKTMTNWKEMNCLSWKTGMMSCSRNSGSNLTMRMKSWTKGYYSKNSNWMTCSNLKMRKKGSNLKMTRIPMSC